jgi:hypothetical protein
VTANHHANLRGLGINRRIGMALMAPVLLLLHPALALERLAPPQDLFGGPYADVELCPAAGGG